MSSVSKVKPHAVLTPFPLQGPINPMFQLAKLLHTRGFHIAFVHTEYNYKRLLKSSGSSALDGLPDFHFETIPDGLPSMDVDVAQDIPSLCESTRKNCLGPFCDLLARLNNSASAGLTPPVSCLVSDAIMSFTINAAKQFGVPIVTFYPASACSLLAIFHCRSLIEKGFIPFKDWIPSMKYIRLKDFPTHIRTTDPNDLLLDFMIQEIHNAHKASAIAINTFEDETLNALSSIYTSLSLYTVGLLPSFLIQGPQHELASVGLNLRKEEIECRLEWLETMEPESVVYVNFGSRTIMSNERLFEFAWGLAESKKPFSWIIRPKLVNGGSTILSSEFVNEIKDRVLIVSWRSCSQEKVLNHYSIGGFLTHYGWNSMTEIVCVGVPILCWPFFGDQQINCRYACTKWAIGHRIDGKQKNHGMEEIGRGGSSYVNFDKVIKDVMLKQN